MKWGWLLIVYLLLELWLLIELGGWIGGFNVILWVVGSFILGVFLLRGERLAQAMSFRQDYQSNRLTPEMLNAKMIKLITTILGAVLLILPGLLTDILGLLLIFPGTQWLLAQQLSHNFAQHMGQTTTSYSYRQSSTGEIIEGEIIESTSNIGRDPQEKK